ncbi:MAG: energy transducer TonB [Ignavibacteriales bacterium]|nr:energy transducer TonB [Ignavibacteriales bacterium]
MNMQNKKRVFLFNYDVIYYELHIKVGVVISLLISIFLFFVFPKNKTEKKEIPYFYEPLITVIDIPNTKQSLQSAPPIPAAPVISNLLLPVEDPEILPDVVVKEASSHKSGTVEGTSKGSGKTGVYEASSFPFVPRQILEVVPKNEDDSEGFVKIRVLVGVDGYVREHKILSNTTKSEVCLRNVVNAVYKSRWQPIAIEGEKVEYWIEKTYAFN